MVWLEQTWPPQRFMRHMSALAHGSIELVKTLRSGFQWKLINYVTTTYPEKINSGFMGLG